MYLLNSACLESQIQLIRKIRFPHNLVLGYTFFFFFFFGKEESWEREEEGEERKEGKCCSGGASGILRKKRYWFETPFMSLWFSWGGPAPRAQFYIREFVLQYYQGLNRKDQFNILLKYFWDGGCGQSKVKSQALSALTTCEATTFRVVHSLLERQLLVVRCNLLSWRPSH